MKRFNLYVAILLMCLLGTCSMVKAETIKVTQAGTLYSLVGNKLRSIYCKWRRPLLRTTYYAK